jgi:hypothetical protein
MQNIQLNLPKKISVSQLADLQILNPDWIFESSEEKTLLIREGNLTFEEVDFLDILQPADFRFTPLQFERLCRLNKETGIGKFEISFSSPQKLQIHMGTAFIISVFTGAIYALIYLWAKKGKKGAATTETARFNLTDKNGNQFFKCPDIAYLDEEQTEKALSEKEKFVNFAPFFCVEVVSAPKNGLKQSLDKMKNIWMENGTKIGLVIDPFGKNYYLFEANKSSFEKISFKKAFKHTKLKGLMIDFDALWREAGGE